jgi:hypothetical protein
VPTTCPSHAAYGRDCAASERRATAHRVASTGTRSTPRAEPADGAHRRRPARRTAGRDRTTGRAVPGACSARTTSVSRSPRRPITSPRSVFFWTTRPERATPIIGVAQHLGALASTARAPPRAVALSRSQRPTRVATTPATSRPCSAVKDSGVQARFAPSTRGFSPPVTLLEPGERNLPKQGDRRAPFRPIASSASAGCTASSAAVTRRPARPRPPPPRLRPGYPTGALREETAEGSGHLTTQCASEASRWIMAKREALQSMRLLRFLQNA